MILLDEMYMKLAIHVAKKGKGKVSPNPLVGAVIVKDSKIVSCGYHEKFGGSHAEVNAVNNANVDLKGSTMYVTLEPCCHYGKTPPCVDLIIEKGISKVIVGTLDPNPKVAGKGVKKLKDAGIEVIVGFLEEKCKKMNEIFMKYIKTRKPFVNFKMGMSLDGKIGTKTGESMWITGEKSRESVHKLRGELTGIMVGIGTVIKDNPNLTCRIKGYKNPIRIILDSKLRIPLNAKVLNGESRTIIATTKGCNKEKEEELIKKGIEVLKIKSKEEKIDLNSLMSKLGELKIDSILLEGGSDLGFSSLKEGIIDKVLIYIAPKMIGGEKAKGPLGGLGIERLKDAFLLKNIENKRIGNDILISAYISKGEE